MSDDGNAVITGDFEKDDEPYAEPSIAELPPLPASLEVGDHVLVARWAGPRYGAVSWVSRYVDEDGRDWTDDRTDAFLRTADGWDDIGSGGAAGDSSDDPTPLQRIPNPRVAYLGGSGGSDDCVYVEGRAGSDAVWVEVTDADGTLRRAIESPIGRIVVAASGESEVTVRVLDADGGELGATHIRSAHPPRRRSGDEDAAPP